MSVDENNYLVSPGPLWKRIMKRSTNQYRPVVGWASPKGSVSIFDNGTFQTKRRIEEGKIVDDFDLDELKIGLIALGLINPKYRDVKLKVNKKKKVSRKPLTLKRPKPEN